MDNVYRFLFCRYYVYPRSWPRCVYFLSYIYSSSRLALRTVLIILYRVTRAILPCERNSRASPPCIWISLYSPEPRVLAPPPRTGGGRGPCWSPMHTLLRDQIWFYNTCSPVHRNLSTVLQLWSFFSFLSFFFSCASWVPSKYKSRVTFPCQLVSLSAERMARSAPRLVHVEGRVAAKIYFLLPNTSPERRPKSLMQLNGVSLAGFFPFLLFSKTDPFLCEGLYGTREAPLKKDPSVRHTERSRCFIPCRVRT